VKARANFLVLLALSGLAVFGRDNPNANAPEPRWKIDLKDRFNFEAFDRAITFRWTLQQNVDFLSDDKVLVYQVNRSRAPVKLAPRDASGGSGNFILDIRVLSAQDGHEIKALRLTTNAEATEVLPTRDGRFLVRTGDVLYLYSAGFQKIAEKPLPLQRKVIEEAWQIDVSPSGKHIVLVHQQIFKRDQLSPMSEIEKSTADVEILKEETLETESKFSLPWFLASWSAGEHVLLSSKPFPSLDPALFGWLDYHGNWTPLSVAEYSPGQHCTYQATVLDDQFFAAYGCGTLSVCRQNGQTVFSIKSASKEYVGSVKGTGSSLAVQMERHLVRTDGSANIPIRVTKPLRIDVYDTANRKPVLSAPVHGDRIYYAVTQQGALAVVDGTSLVLYHTGR
jgi:hypothetical protein